MEEKFCNWEENKDAILMMCTEMYHGKRHLPIIYGDYFFAEAIYRLMGFDTLYPNDKNIVKIFNKDYEVVDYCELITSTTAEVIGTYSTDFYKDFPAILKNKYNNRTAYYIGCRDTGALLGDFYKSVLNECNIACYNLPDGATVHSRTDEENEYLFVENYTEKQQNINISIECLDMETGKIYNGKVEEHNVKILKVLK